MSETQQFNEKLWEEIPVGAFIALGRRGRESISLRECYIPGCENKDQDKLHPINKTQKIEENKEKQVATEWLSYTIYCDDCKKSFQLVFERHIDLAAKESGINPDGIVLERVYATDESGDQNFGEIGWIQFK